jgi:hypothetical protein
MLGPGDNPLGAEKSVYLLRYSTRPMGGANSGAHQDALSINYLTLDHALDGARVAMAADPSIFVAIATQDGQTVYATSELRERLGARINAASTLP